MASTAAECAQYAADLATLMAARLRIAAGGSLVRVRHSDKETAFSPANLDSLNREINRLQNLVAGCNGRTTSGFPGFVPTDN